MFISPNPQYPIHTYLPPLRPPSPAEMSELEPAGHQRARTASSSISWLEIFANMRDEENSRRGSRADPDTMPPGIHAEAHAAPDPKLQDYPEYTGSSDESSENGESSDIDPFSREQTQTPISPVAGAPPDIERRRQDTEELLEAPPSARLTGSGVKLPSSIEYSRSQKKVIAYMIPLPRPVHDGVHGDVPQRYLLYTPPSPDVLKPQDGDKESKRQKLKRLSQQEVRKAKTYTGRTWSIRGLHAKSVRGIDKAIAALKSTDITFLNRIPRKTVKDITIIHPPVLVPRENGIAHLDVHNSHRPAPCINKQGEWETIPGPRRLHEELVTQLNHTKRRARRDAILSTSLLGPAIIIDVLSALIWPFGGLAEIDGVWMHTSISAWLTARSITRRLKPVPPMDMAEQRPRLNLRGFHQPRGELQNWAGEAAASPVVGYCRPLFTVDQDMWRELGTNDQRYKASHAHGRRRRTENQGAKAAGSEMINVRFCPEPAMEVLSQFLQEHCNKRNPRLFASPVCVAPTARDVLSSIGWWPDRRGKRPLSNYSIASYAVGNWEDENWQTYQVREDLERVMRKSAKSWDRFCRRHARYPQRLMKENVDVSLNSLARRGLHARVATLSVG